MSQVSDVSIANQGFSAFRTELNNILAALNSMHSGTSRPSSAVAGTLWIDNGTTNTFKVKIFDTFVCSFDSYIHIFQNKRIRKIINYI